MTDASTEINVSYTNWRGVTSVRRVWLGDVRFGTTEWHEEPTWVIKAFDLDHPAQIWKEFDLLKCDFNREGIGKNKRIAELEAALDALRGRYRVYAGWPEMNWAGLTDLAVLKMADDALNPKTGEK